MKIAKILLFLMCLAMVAVATPAKAAPAYVNSSICGSGTASVSAQTCSLSVTAGNQLFVSASTTAFVTRTFTISDNAVIANTYTTIANTLIQKVWLVSSLTGTETVTVTVTSNSADGMTVAMEQVSGATGNVDVSAASNTVAGVGGANGGPPKVYTCVGLTTTVANDYIFGVGALRNQVNGIGTMTYDLTDDTVHPGTTGAGNRVAYGHLLTTTPLSVTPTFSCTSGTVGNCTGTNNSCVVVAIKAPVVTSSRVKHRVIQQ